MPFTTLAGLLGLIGVLSGGPERPPQPSAFQPASTARSMRTEGGEAIIPVKKVGDFTVSGDGSAANWAAVPWVELPQRQTHSGSFTTRVKTAYSDKGLYFLFDCADRKLAANFDQDFLDLWTQDVAEVFLWPDTTVSDYLEYEISPLNHELPILVSNKPHAIVRWMPFHYEKDRKVIHAVKVRGGEQRPDAAITGWTAEFFIPFPLLRPLRNIAPAAGTRWRANFYRVDYNDPAGASEWSWQPTDSSFHEYAHFGTLLFQ